MHTLSQVLIIMTMLLIKGLGALNIVSPDCTWGGYQGIGSPNHGPAEFYDFFPFPDLHIVHTFHTFEILAVRYIHKCYDVNHDTTCYWQELATKMMSKADDCHHCDNSATRQKAHHLLEERSTNDGVQRFAWVGQNVEIRYLNFLSKDITTEWEREAVQQDLNLTADSMAQ
jgi:hypothetical protein